jgi:hypothetical protein
LAALPLSLLSSPGPPTQGTDYTVGGGATGTNTFAAGSATATVTIYPAADTTVEPCAPTTTNLDGPDSLAGGPCSSRFKGGWLWLGRWISGSVRSGSNG